MMNSSEMKENKRGERASKKVLEDDVIMKNDDVIISSLLTTEGIMIT